MLPTSICAFPFPIKAEQGNVDQQGMLGMSCNQSRQLCRTCSPARTPSRIAAQSDVPQAVGQSTVASLCLS